jgi:lactoylglutathione lyase
MRTGLVGWRVTDVDRSLAFYRALGYDVLGRVHLDEDATLVVMKFPDEPVASLEIVHSPADGSVRPSGIDHLAVDVDDLVATVERLTATGLRPGPVESPGGPDGPRVAWLTDPDGYRIELVEWPPGHPPGLAAADFA